MTFSCRTLLASARPAMSFQDTPGLASSMSLRPGHDLGPHGSRVITHRAYSGPGAPATMYADSLDGFSSRPNMPAGLASSRSLHPDHVQRLHGSTVIIFTMTPLDVFQPPYMLTLSMIPMHATDILPWPCRLDFQQVPASRPSSEVALQCRHQTC